MNKVNYKAIDVNKLDWHLMQKKFCNHAVLFSIDVAKTAFVGLLMNKEQDAVQLIKWTHPQDTGALLEQLCGLGSASLEAIMEPTGTYGDALRRQLTQRSIPVYRVNPKHTHDQAESFDGVPGSHDAKAAYIIADLHQRGRSELWQETPTEQRELRGLVNEMEIHQRLHRANLNRLSALLVRHWPELESVIDLGTVSALSLLSQYGAPSQVTQDITQAHKLLRQAGGPGLKATKREAILAAAQNTPGMPCTPEERHYIQELASDLLRTRHAGAAVEKRMTQVMAEHEELTNVVQLCGKVTGTVLIAILGDLRDYPNAQSLVKAAGLNLKEHSSGRHKGRLSITKRGSGKIRFYLYWLVLRLIQHDAPIKAWYERKVTRDGGRGKGRAIVAIMRKLLKALWHVAQGQVFDSRKLFNLETITN